MRQLPDRVSADRRIEIIGCMQDLSSPEILNSIWVEENYEVGTYDNSPYSYFETLVLDYQLDENPGRWVGNLLHNQHEADVLQSVVRLFAEVYEANKAELDSAAAVLADPRWPEVMSRAELAYITLLFGGNDAATCAAPL